MDNNAGNYTISVLMEDERCPSVVPPDLRISHLLKERNTTGRHRFVFSLISHGIRATVFKTLLRQLLSKQQFLFFLVFFFFLIETSQILQIINRFREREREGWAEKRVRVEERELWWNTFGYLGLSSPIFAVNVMLTIFSYRKWDSNAQVDIADGYVALLLEASQSTSQSLQCALNVSFKIRHIKLFEFKTNLHC